MPPSGYNDTEIRPEHAAQSNVSGSNAAIKFLTLCMILALVAVLAMWKIFQISAAGGRTGQLFWLFLIGSFCLYGSYVFARVWWTLSRLGGRSHD